MRERTNRSDKYQYVLLEIPCSDDLLNSFDNSESVGGRLASAAEHKEATFELKERLKKRLFELMEIHATDRQKLVCKMWMDGYTQMEIAKMLNVNQSSITKSLNGNTEYSNKSKTGKKAYGGLFKKMRKICSSDPIIQQVLLEMSQLEFSF